MVLEEKKRTVGPTLDSQSKTNGHHQDATLSKPKIRTQKTTKKEVEIMGLMTELDITVQNIMKEIESEIKDLDLFLKSMVREEIIHRLKLQQPNN